VVNDGRREDGHGLHYDRGSSSEALSNDDVMIHQ
jgi:hypothetical protein